MPLPVPVSPKPGAQAIAFWLGPTLQRLNKSVSGCQAEMLWGCDHIGDESFQGHVALCGSVRNSAREG